MDTTSNDFLQIAAVWLFAFYGVIAIIMVVITLGKSISERKPSKKKSEEALRTNNRSVKTVSCHIPAYADRANLAQLKKKSELQNKVNN